MKTNELLQKDVQDAIKWEPLLNAAEIGVTAKDGVITLTGTVDSYAKKLEAEDAAKNVAGVRAVVEKIEIKFGHYGKATDNEIATAVLNALKGNWQVPSANVKVKVEDGWITLEGEVEFNYQREAAKKAINLLMGVKGVSNNIKLVSETKDEVEQKDIEKALERNWSINANDITVKVKENNVILKGTVNSWYQKDEAERIAWKARGVSAVDNELIVEYDYALVD